jgi:hypothetical protein
MDPGGLVMFVSHISPQGWKEADGALTNIEPESLLAIHRQDRYAKGYCHEELTAEATISSRIAMVEDGVGVISPPHVAGGVSHARTSFGMEY